MYSEMPVGDSRQMSEVIGFHESASGERWGAPEHSFWSTCFSPLTVEGGRGRKLGIVIRCLMWICVIALFLLNNFFHICEMQNPMCLLPEVHTIPSVSVGSKLT